MCRRVAINWNDADDNNAFHAKQIVMDLDGTISTEVAVCRTKEKQDYDDIVTMGLPLSNDGKPVPSKVTIVTLASYRRAQKCRSREGFPKYFIQPEVKQRAAENRAGRQHPGDAGDR